MRRSILLATLFAACTTEPAAPPAQAPAPPPKATAPEVVASPAPQGASRVFFVEPLAGSTVTSPVAVKMGVEGMEVKPAGTMVPGTGHHHLVIDGPAVAKDEVVPADDTHIHYGDGRTATEVALPPGAHTLTLQFADGAHKSYGPDLSSTIQITVADAPAVATGAGEAAPPPAAPATGGK